jgi:hypothetical protein
VSQFQGAEQDRPSVVSPDSQQLAILGHEIGNVLNGLIGMVELLGESCLSNEQRRWLLAIQQAGLQMQGVVASVRDRASEAEDRWVPRDACFDGVNLLEQTITAHTPMARSRNTELLLITDAGLPRLWHADACLLRQVLENLIGNSLKFTRHGTVVLEAARGRQGASGASSLRLRVSDSGPGIDPASVRGLCEDRSLRSHPNGRDFSGSGLGLGICRSIVDAMDGRMEWSEPPGGGSCFTVSVPDALASSNGFESALRTSLFENVSCCLDLTGPLRRSVSGFLERLGVGLVSAVADAPAATATNTLSLSISSPDPEERSQGAALVLRPIAGAPADGGWRMAAPILESSLGESLLRVRLERVALAVSGERTG